MRIFLLFFLLLFSGLLANSQVPFTLNSSLQKEDLTSVLSIHEDKVGKLEVSDLKEQFFTPLTESNMGYSDSTFWVELPVRNPDSTSKKWYLVYESSVIDRIELYRKGEKQPLLILGDQVAFGNRSVDYRFPTFALEEKAKSETIYYLKIKSQSTIPIQIYAYSEIDLINFISSEQIVLGLYYGWMFVMVLYNLFLYISTRYKSYIYYVLFIWSFSFFQFILNGLGFQFLWPNSFYWANTSLLVFMIMATLTGSMFAANFLKSRQVFWLYRIYESIWVLGFILLVLSFFISYSISIKLSTYYAGLVALLLIFNAIYAWNIDIKQAKIFSLAFGVFILGVILFTLKSTGILPTNIYTSWTIQIGSALVVLLLSLGLADKINELSGDLKIRVDELGELNAKLNQSERRFRELFHGVGDIIFVLDSNWNFIDVNRAVTKHMGFKQDEIKGKNILEFIYKNKGINDTYNRIFVMEKLEELMETGTPVEFQSEFRQKYVMEPKELYLKLQFVELDETKEILGTASVIIEDVLNRYIKSERISFGINNYLRNAEIFSQKLTSHISKFSDNDTALAVKTSLREIIINAIEHGNLNITFDEKTKAMSDGNYLSFIQQRQEDPRYRDKTVNIEYVLDTKKVAFRITDEGNGFDHKKTMETKLDKLNQENIQHGRGIMMTKDVFDIIEYNDIGNQVSLVKYFR
ncbi:MAG: ATP-binding protein [Leptospiraceae bacterium]|nr:ATP-binding protein [Leptospiraceae bacterium]